MLPFHKTNDLDIAYNIESNESILDNINNNTDCFNHYNQANLCEIDPDINYLANALVVTTLLSVPDVMPYVVTYMMP